MWRRVKDTVLLVCAASVLGMFGCEAAVSETEETCQAYCEHAIEVCDSTTFNDMYEGDIEQCTQKKVEEAEDYQITQGDECFSAYLNYLTCMTNLSCVDWLDKAVTETDCATDYEDYQSKCGIGS